MAGFNLVTSLPKFGHAGATIARARAWNPRVFAAATPRPIQVPTNQDGSLNADGIKQGASETVNNNMTESLQDKAYSTAEHMTNKTKDTAGQISATAQNITEKAKQTMQEAWDSTKNTANRAADTVLGKAQDSADSVKENAEAARRNINNRKN
ncbi:uncharacterized protein At4g13230 [Gastrolobium bilobum]|uniref:uncharacterized protein At4g13230 n=1 Tax=Gastrolobium bilobum TaxID=150636 RepID=UPI002AAFF208|nr:uncharacterized protein At4g13230 [Gastrolobium bilobum]